MADEYLYSDDGQITRKEFTTVSTGPADAGKGIGLNEDGQVDPSMLPPGGNGVGFEPYVFHQTNPSTMWHIVHAMGFDPTPVVVSADGTVIGGFGRQYPDTNTCDLYFGTPISGVATLS